MIYWKETITEKGLMADILDKDFKTTILKMLRELKDNGKNWNNNC